MRISSDNVLHVNEHLKEKMQRGVRRGGETRARKHIYVLVLSFFCTFLPSVEAMHTLTALLYHLQQNVDGLGLRNSELKISDRHKKTQKARGLFIPL